MGETRRFTRHQPSALSRQTLVRREKCREALAQLTQAIRREPDDATAYFYRGLAWFAAQECDKAIADYDEALRLDPGSQGVR